MTKEFSKPKKRLFALVGSVLLLSGLYSLFHGCILTRSKQSKDIETDGQKIPVVLAKIERRHFEDRILVQGNVKAKDFVAVPALVGGTIKRLYVDEGDDVIAGQTKLFDSDPLKFEKLVQIRKQELVLAGCTHREQAANLDRVRADFDKARVDVERFRKLYEKGAISSDALEQQESRFKQVSAVLKQAETALQSGAELETQARAALAIAEKDLRDCTVYAPISGKVSRIIVEEGEMGEMGKPVLRIDDPSVVEISALLPAEYYDKVFPGTSVVRVKVYHTDLGERLIIFKSPVIDTRLRTFEIKTIIEQPPENVVPGAIADCEVVFEQRDALGVPKTSIQTRSGVATLFSVDQDRARKLEVMTGLETDGWLEISGEGIAEGIPVVVMGQFLLDEGTPVSIQENVH